MKIRTQVDDMVGLWVFRLTDWANQEVTWNSQFYRVIHIQLYYSIKLVETLYWVRFYCESVGHSFIVGYGSKYTLIIYKYDLHILKFCLKIFISYVLLKVKKIQWYLKA